MALTTEQKKAILAEYGVHEKDTGSPEAQIAMLTKRISDITEHLKKHKHDHHTRHGLMQLIGRRKRLSKYLQDKDIERYRALIERLGLRR
ncbi:30S ribosomal protein S15 [Nocardia terpenica]|uniref:Small ribosomal subunit protein uS15 n=1 Tax=Nocardia terpenica TaxID=455432 RepID=A0A164P624_9NOCA|nr:30S ribosomal protein S15 [Nocardia terpenica]ATL69081.1 30S ribosomal protein S15 [Nocardia terpenica]KZM75168.1 30S ribosomal protein S15 [Nocardia terpenica]MBF6065293.1 30S ribosomal protein S15 [Nocardia terpenica]MBF6108020.1 30S ribosomal protein S15 [Nocardia terpenica]MBF6115449.1 30S ribosomal protein S15 [Nocardia terpenica]